MQRDMGQRDMGQREPWAPWHGKAMESDDARRITANGVCPHFPEYDAQSHHI
jgi:hypothetical protein